MRQWTTLHKYIWLRILQGASSVIKVVTGTVPLTLADAVSKGIESLVQYGKCETVSGDVYCNNGAIKVSPNLLDSSAENTTLGKYIEKNTGKVSNSSANFMFEEYMPVVGGKTYVAYGRTWDGTDLSDYNRVAWYDTSKTWISGANYTQNQISVVTAPSNAAYARFSCNITGNTSTTVTQELVDSYYWVFQEGTEEPSVVHPYHELYVEGTPEVLTISASGAADQTASVPNLFATDGAADEVDIISGVVTRNVEVTVSGATIAITPLSTPITETVTPQPLTTAKGDNTVSVTAEVSSIELAVEYNGTP